PRPLGTSRAAAGVTASIRNERLRVGRRLVLSPSLGGPPLHEGAGLERVRGEPDIHGALLEPHLLALHHGGRDLVLAGILVDPEIAEQPPDLAARRAADAIGERDRPLRLGLAVIDHPTGPRDGRRPREAL